VLTRGACGDGMLACDWSQARNRTTPDNLQEKSDSLENFLDRFNHTVVQSGLSLVQFCKKADISRSLFYEIRDGNRAVSDKVWRKLEAAEEDFGVNIEKGSSVPRGTLEKGSDAETSGNPNETEKGSGQFTDSGKLMEEAAVYSVPTRSDNYLRRIAEALEEIARKLPDHLQL